MSLLEQWTLALDALVIRHIDPTCTPLLEIVGTEDRPTLRVAVANARDTRDQDVRFDVLTINDVLLTYWPGQSTAQAWIAAAWAGYLLHEGLELVTMCGGHPLDPHLEPFDFDRGLRDGTPRELTPQALRRTLEIVMSPAAADRIITEGID